MPKNRFITLWALLMLVLVTSCETVPESLNMVSMSPMPSAGINWGYPRAGTENYPLFEEMGIEWYRIDFYWNKLEAEQGVWKFDENDFFCAEAKARGYRIVGVLGFDTPWIHDDPEGKRQVDPDQLEHYLNYVKTVVTRYQGVVDEWEIWNEPNLFFNTFWTGSNRDFLALTAATTEEIKNIDESIQVAGGSLWRHDPLYINKMARAGILDNIDILTYHPYYDQPDKILRRSRDLENHARKKGFEGEFRITEVGFNTYGNVPTSCTYEEQGRLVLETLLKLGTLNHPYIIWYNLSNSYKPDMTGLWDDQYGLLIKKQTEFEYKTGGYAFRLYNHLIAGRYASDHPLGINDSLKGKIEGFLYEDDSDLPYVLVLMGDKASLNIKLDGFTLGRLYNGATGEENLLRESFAGELRKNEPYVFVLDRADELRIYE